ncbi:MAG: GGDEF domain-containing protein [Oscillospiraceae bacterium]|nr:GGDEF domain-containing protein [Oscillospiraceae bacterium]
MSDNNIMNDIQGMIGTLLTSTVEKMQSGENSADPAATSAQADIAEIKNFVDAMQKFINNVNVMVKELEAENAQPGTANEKILDGYIATADNVLEIASFSMKDGVTGLSDRSGFDNRIILEWNRAVRDKSTLGLVIFSIDGLEDCEDIKRDEILREASQALIMSNKRSTDFIARWSEEEFVVLLPITDTEGTTIVTGRIRADIEHVNIPGTISIGACVYVPKQGEQPDEFIDRAIEAHSKAKASGGITKIFT